MTLFVVQTVHTGIPQPIYITLLTSNTKRICYLPMQFLKFKRKLTEETLFVQRILDRYEYKNDQSYFGI